MSHLRSTGNSRTRTKAADTNGHDERDSISSRFVEEVVVVDVLVGGVHVDEVRGRGGSRRCHGHADSKTRARRPRSHKRGTSAVAAETTSETERRGQRGQRHGGPARAGRDSCSGGGAPWHGDYGAPPRSPSPALVVVGIGAGLQSPDPSSIPAPPSPPTRPTRPHCRRRGPAVPARQAREIGRAHV